MPLQDLTPPPPPPARSDAPEDFIAKADAWLVWQATFASEVTTLASQIEAAGAMIAAASAYADPGLLALAGQTPAADRLPYYTGASTSALAVMTSAGRALLDDADAAAQRATLGLGSAALQAATAFEAAGALAGHVGASDPHTQYLLDSAVSAFMLTLLDDANAATALATLGIGTVSGTESSGKILLGSFALTWRDHSVTANTTTSCAYGADHTYSSWARAWFNGGNPSNTQQDNGPYVSSPGLSSASVFNALDSAPTGTLFSIGV